MYWMISPCGHVVRIGALICIVLTIMKGWTDTVALPKSHPAVSASSTVIIDDISVGHEDASTNCGSCGSVCSALSTKYPVGYRRCMTARDVDSQLPPEYAATRSEMSAPGS
jgi:hypothetical protein